VLRELKESPEQEDPACQMGCIGHVCVKRGGKGTHGEKLGGQRCQHRSQSCAPSKQKSACDEGNQEIRLSWVW
jgi:hypothetical protein